MEEEGEMKFKTIMTFVVWLLKRTKLPLANIDNKTNTNNRRNAGLKVTHFKSKKCWNVLGIQTISYFPFPFGKVCGKKAT